MDLLTVLEHEIGHFLGKEHEAGGVMAESLAAGMRRVPTATWSPLDAAILEWLAANKK